MEKFIPPDRGTPPAAGESALGMNVDNDWCDIIESAEFVTKPAEPVAAPVSEPVAVPISEPVAVPVSEPVAAPVSEPISESVTPAAELRRIAKPVTVTAAAESPLDDEPTEPAILPIRVPVEEAPRPLIAAEPQLDTQPPIELTSKRRYGPAVAVAVAAAAIVVVIAAVASRGGEESEPTSTATAATLAPPSVAGAEVVSAARADEAVRRLQTARDPSAVRGTEPGVEAPDGAAVPSEVIPADPDVLLEQAKQARERGELLAAYELAKQSQAGTRSNEAVELMVSVSCQRGQKKRARRLVTMLPAKRRSLALRRCRTMGVTLAERKSKRREG